MNLEGGNAAAARLNSVHIPKLEISENVVRSTPRRTFSNAHAYHINSISMNSDGETYLSADDLRINLWNLNISDQASGNPLLRRRSRASPHRDDASPAPRVAPVPRSTPDAAPNLQSYNIVDIKPANMEELTEVITASVLQACWVRVRRHRL